MIDVIVFATEAHEGQVRKYTGVPYITHPISVGFIIASVRWFTNDQDVIAAGILHDVLEDTDRTVEDIFELCNQRVTDFVEDVTDISKLSDGNRLDNAPGIIKYDPEFAKVWIAEKKELLPHLIEGNPILYMRLEEILDV